MVVTFKGSGFHGVHKYLGVKFHFHLSGARGEHKSMFGFGYLCLLDGDKVKLLGRLKLGQNVIIFKLDIVICSVKGDFPVPRLDRSIRRIGTADVRGQCGHIDRRVELSVTRSIISTLLLSNSIDLRTIVVKRLHVEQIEAMSTERAGRIGSHTDVDQDGLVADEKNKIANIIMVVTFICREFKLN